MILNWMWVRVDEVYIRHFTHVFDLQFSHRRVYFIFICLFFLMNAIISTQIENDVLISSPSERFDFVARNLIKIERYTAVLQSQGSHNISSERFRRCEMLTLHDASHHEY